MKTLLKELKEKFEELEDACEKCEEHPCTCVDEASVAAGAGAYTPKDAFAKSEKKKMKYPGVAEAMDKKYEAIIESSYRKFAKDPDTTPSKKVNLAIREMAWALKEIESHINNATRLKTEQGVTQDHYWKSMNKNITKISERLIKIAERVRALGE